MGQQRPQRRRHLCRRCWLDRRRWNAIQLSSSIAVGNQAAEAVSGTVRLINPAAATNTRPRAVVRWSMIRSRPLSKSKPPGRAPLSDDRFDKLVAALNWWIGRDKTRPEYVQAPHYHDAIQRWWERLSLDDQERVHTIVYVYSVPYGGEKAAVDYAAFRPDVPPPPEIVRKAWLGSA